MVSTFSFKVAQAAKFAKTEINKFWVMLWEKEYKFGQVLWRCCKRIACQSLIHMTKENF